MSESLGNMVSKNIQSTTTWKGKAHSRILRRYSEKDDEEWVPFTSSILQIIVSLLGLVLVKEPFYSKSTCFSSICVPGVCLSLATHNQTQEALRVQSRLWSGEILHYS